MTRIGIYLGNVSDPVSNIKRVLSSWGDYFESDVELEAFGSAPLPNDVASKYNKISTTRREAHTPFDKIFQTYRDGHEYIRRRSPDLVIQLWKYHTHAPGISLAGWRTRTPVIARFTGDVFNEYRQYSGTKRLGAYVLSHGFGRLPLRLADRIIALGPYGQSQLTTYGMDPDATCLLPPPSDTTGQFSPVSDERNLRSRYDLPEDRPIAIYVGRLTEAKGMRFLERVIERVDRKMTFLLVGDGPYRSKFRELYNRNKVRAVGYVPHDEIDAYYKTADVYVHPSAYEGLPLVLIEALECGLPVVAKDAGDVDFVTSNIVETPDEMVRYLAGPLPDTEWLNREYFTYEFQKKQLTSLVSSVVSQNSQY